MLAMTGSFTPPHTYRVKARRFEVEDFAGAETKRRYQLGMVEEVREAMNLANTEAFGQLENHIFSTVTSPIATNRKEDAAELVET
jgi:hypothetical protein